MEMICKTYSITGRTIGYNMPKGYVNISILMYLN